MALLVQAMWATPQMLVPTWNDAGSSSDLDLQGWTAANLPPGFYAVGDLVQSSANNSLYGSAASGALLLLKDISTDGDVALQPIQSYFPIWQSGDFADAPGTVFVGHAGNSEPVGLFLVSGSNSPTGAYANLNPAVLLQGQVGAQIWDTGDTRDALAASFWRIAPTPAAPSGIPFGIFYWTQGIAPPPPGQAVNTLNPQFVQWTTP